RLAAGPYGDSSSRTVSSPRRGRGGTLARGPSIHRPPCGDRPHRFDTAAADSDIPVVEVDGRVAMTRHELHLVAELQPVARRRDAEPAVLVGGAFIGRGGLVPHGRRPGIEG